LGSMGSRRSRHFSGARRVIRPLIHLPMAALSPNLERMKYLMPVLLISHLFFGAACSHSSISPQRKSPPRKVNLNILPLPSAKFSSTLLGKRKVTYPLMTKIAEINIWETGPSPHGPTPNAYPMIEVKTPYRRDLISLKEFPSFSVTHVFQDLPGGKILILLDYSVEGPLEEYARVMSEDEGHSWKKLSPLPKNPGIFPFGELISLWGNNKGEWTAHFSQDNKIYRSHSQDEGESWQPEAKPIYENEWTPLSPSF